MPQFEQGDLAKVAESARTVSADPAALDRRRATTSSPWSPSCALMLKFEWPLILPDDAECQALSEATFDISEYVVDIAKREGLRARA